MAVSKQYKDAQYYEQKLQKIMDRLEVSEYTYNWDRFSSYIQFMYKGEFYKFEHSVAKAKEHGQNLYYGSDTFAQLVLTLEDIARMTERGIYELQTWVAGLKMLPPQKEIPICFQTLQFTEIPSFDELKKRFAALAKVAHPDSGGSNEQFIALKEAYDKAKEYLEDQ